ncbi:hypothetical protein LUTEI9C_70243 [Luteimonas sp. 9C]|nr:hypothetical protein LUTEI9C_70243 [Luteimonas sp. 9C]
MGGRARGGLIKPGPALRGPLPLKDHAARVARCVGAGALIGAP